MRVVLLFAAATMVLICGCRAVEKGYFESPRPSFTERERSRSTFTGPDIRVYEDVPASDKEQFLFQQAGGEEGGAVKTKRMIIYTASFLLSVYDLGACAKKIIELAEQAGGFVSSQTNEEVVIRVPAEKFKQVTEALPNIGRVVSKKIQAADITEQYLDVELRLSSKHKYLASLQELLGKAQDAKTMLEIQKEVYAVLEEIEALEGKLRYLKDQVAFSTITVHLELATAKPHRAFSLPIDWIQTLGIEGLIIVGGGAR